MNAHVSRFLLVAVTGCAVLSPFALGQAASPAPEAVPGTQTAAAPSGPGGMAQGATPRAGTRPPAVLSAPNPTYTEEARQNKVSGDVVIALTVDEHGLPQDVRVKRGLGSGLDEKAVEAVRQYKFKPATRDGVPVATHLFINVNFKIF